MRNAAFTACSAPARPKRGSPAATTTYPGASAVPSIAPDCPVDLERPVGERRVREVPVGSGIAPRDRPVPELDVPPLDRAETPRGRDRERDERGRSRPAGGPRPPSRARHPAAPRAVAGSGSCRRGHESLRARPFAPENASTTTKITSASATRGTTKRLTTSATPTAATMSATNAPVPSEPECSIRASLRMLTGESTEMPGNVGKGSPQAATATTAVTAATPTASLTRRTSSSAAAEPTSRRGRT